MDFPGITEMLTKASRNRSSSTANSKRTYPFLRFQHALKEHGESSLTRSVDAMLPRPTWSQQKNSQCSKNTDNSSVRNSSPERDKRICTADEVLEKKRLLNQGCDKRVFSSTEAYQVESYKLTSGVSAEQQKLVPPKQPLSHQEQDITSPTMSHDFSTQVRGLQGEVETLRLKLRVAENENYGLKEQAIGDQKKAERMEQHILSLQSYRSHILPDAAKTDFGMIVESVCDWVFNHISHNIDTPKKRAKCVERNLMDTTGLLKLKKWMDAFDKQYVTASQLPGADDNIIAAIVLRFIHEAIFSRTLGGLVRDITYHIDQIVTTMGDHTKPKTNLFASRQWRAEALNALVSHPGIVTEREARAKSVVETIMDALGLFFKDAAETADASKSILELVIRPALQLKEDVDCGTDSYSFVYSEFNLPPATSDGGPVTDPAFYRHLGTMKLANVSNHMKDVVIDRLDPKPSDEELPRVLKKQCALYPAFTHQMVGDEANQDVRTLRPQYMLVSYGNEWKPTMDEFSIEDERLLWSLYQLADDLVKKNIQECW